MRAGFVVASLTAVVALLIGCGLLPVNSVETVLPAGAHKALPVVVDDPAGLIRAIEPNAPGDLGTIRDGPMAIPGSPMAATMAWTGGACDTQATITVRATNDRITIGVRTKATFGCEDVGVFRRVTLEFAEPIGDRRLVDGGKQQP